MTVPVYVYDCPRLRAKCDLGWKPGTAPIGYLNDKFAKKGQKSVVLDPERAPIVKQMFEKVAYDGLSGRDLYTWLIHDMNFTTRTGKRLALSRIYTILKDSLYYGEFEFPLGSGKWYKGSYEPIITKELYLKAQARLDKYCKEKPIRGEELTEQLRQLIIKVDLDEIGTREKIEQEIRRYKQFSYSVLGKETSFDKGEIEADIRNYAKHVLTNGTRDEKRAILECVNSRIEVKDKNIRLT